MFIDLQCSVSVASWLISSSGSNPQMNIIFCYNIVFLFHLACIGNKTTQQLNILFPNPVLILPWHCYKDVVVIMLNVLVHLCWCTCSVSATHGCINVNTHIFLFVLLKKTFRQYPTILPRYTPITLYPTAPLYNIIIIFDTVLRQKGILNMKNNEFNSAALFPLWH